MWDLLKTCWTTWKRSPWMPARLYMGMDFGRVGTDTTVIARVEVINGAVHFTQIYPDEFFLKPVPAKN